MQNRSGLLKQLAKAELLVLDDFGLIPFSEQTKRDLLEILTDQQLIDSASPASR